ncbi:hypothetical protein SEA_MILANI_59 [Microbacterium phage Milani]|nr:hypothetical protein SEA_MILANI_59 [Microbacterium phage Milani]
MRRKRHPRVSTSVVEFVPSAFRFSAVTWADFELTTRWPDGRVDVQRVFGHVQPLRSQLELRA